MTVRFSIVLPLIVDCFASNLVYFGLIWPNLVYFDAQIRSTAGGRYGPRRAEALFAEDSVACFK